MGCSWHASSQPRELPQGGASTHLFSLSPSFPPQLIFLLGGVPNQACWISKFPKSEAKLSRARGPWQPPPLCSMTQRGALQWPGYDPLPFLLWPPQLTLFSLRPAGQSLNSPRLCAASPTPQSR